MKTAAMSNQRAVSAGPAPVVRRLGRADYAEVWRAMRAFTAERDAGTPDELWLVEHPPVYTLGQSCKPAEYAHIADIPVVATDRGGQITYHGPGQLVVYVLLDMRRSRQSVRDLVSALEQSVIDLLAGYGLSGARREGAPGVYVDGRKVASLGLRVREGRSYHGLSLNVDMDLGPFGRIDPCGYRGLEVTQLRDLGVDAEFEAVAGDLARRLVGSLKG
jgi:lipoyl(octanoyl) transferase